MSKKDYKVQLLPRGRRQGIRTMINDPQLRCSWWLRGETVAGV